MSLLRPFCALRPINEKASQVAAVPYDVVDKEEAFQLAKNNPLSFLHVSRPEIDLPPGTDPYAHEVYELAAANFKSLIRNCPFIREDKPILYLYRLKMGNHQQTGIFGTFSIDEYESDRIKRHERTRPEKEDDRTRHLLALSAQTGPAFLTYKDVPEINLAMRRIQGSAPVYHFTASDGIEHTLWLIQDPREFVDLFHQRVDALYIADGHHRAAAACRARKELAKNNSNHQGTEDYNFLLAVAFPASQLQILPYHRVIKDLGGLTPEQFLERVRKSFEVKQESSMESHPRQFGMYIQNKWYSLRPLSLSKSEALDVSILQETLLSPILGIEDPRTSKRIEFVGGIRGHRELERLVNEGVAAVAFSVHPVQLKDLMEVSDRGEIMPPKSTWFEPKLRDGLVCHSI